MRAGYDFLLLRCQSGELDEELGEWWTDFMAADGSEREQLLTRKPADDSAAPAKRRRRRGGRSRSKGQGDGPADNGRTE